MMRHPVTVIDVIEDLVSTLMGSPEHLSRMVGAWIG